MSSSLHNKLKKTPGICLFRPTQKTKTTQVVGAGVSHVGTSSWLDTSRIWWTRCLWFWTSVSLTTDLEVALTLTLMDTYITLTIWIGH
jgi:hypothetical protein